ncbi:hypothetical protein [Massilia rubra]|uniref:SMI1/KNR4 family protein n=1 Tax=Massilia rubra TaxID=2607910 RepID=A0ABX0LQZ4_9BURK|nr:hypothetical protein [Massilia rubra]NHZ36983.1 hypothetical protein [Massilia rubra]
MNNKNLLIKIVQNAQRRHVKQLLAQESGGAPGASIVKAIYFPDSSDILQKIIAMLGDERMKKETFYAQSDHLIDEKALSAIASLPDLPALHCFFPNYHANQEYISSDLPVMEIQRASAAQWYRFNALSRERISFFFCAAPDFSCGMVMDVCAGDPAISGSDDPIYDLYSWDFGQP